jgi:hypothetical protein
MALRKLVHKIVSSQSNIKTKVFTNRITMLMFFSINFHFCSDIQLGEVPIPDLFVSSGTENGDIIVIVLELFFFLKSLLPLFGGNV